MKSINKLLISAVSAISLAMPLVALMWRNQTIRTRFRSKRRHNKPSEQGSRLNIRHKKPSEQGSGLNIEKTQNKVQDSKPSEIDPIQNDTTNNQPPKIPNTVGDLFKELRKIRDQYYRFKEKLDSLDW
nr:hypothetical protein [Mycoplasmopsis bovis]